MNSQSLQYTARRKPDRTARIIADGRHHENLHYDFSEFFLLEQGTVLENLFDYWSRQEGAVPAKFSPEIDMPEFGSAVTACLNVTASDPMDFWMNKHRVCEKTGRGADISGQPIKGLSWLNYAAELSSEYNLCRHTGVPDYSEVHQRIDGIESHFTRLMLPISRNPSERVTDIFVCVSHLRENMRIET